MPIDICKTTLARDKIVKSSFENQLSKVFLNPEDKNKMTNYEHINIDRHLKDNFNSTTV